LAKTNPKEEVGRRKGDSVVHFLTSFFSAAMGKCCKCGCKKFVWNPVSAAEALRDRIGRRVEKTEVQMSEDGTHATLKSYPSINTDIHNSRDALRNCLCGHHYNYH